VVSVKLRGVTSTLLAVMAVAVLEASTSAQGGIAEFPRCGSGWVGLSILIPRPEVIAAFGGTVVDVRREDAAIIVTFDVDRVWKGTISKRTTVYRPNPASGDSRQVFDSGERYVVLAHSMTATERAQFRADAASQDALAVGLCGDGSRPFTVAEREFADIGPGKPPQP
jgi:hypothetical protein